MTEAQLEATLVAGRYQLMSMIGRGGTGAVWRANDRHLARQVAIKQIVTSEHRSMRSRERALREGKAVAQLRTPGVVQMYDMVDIGPYVYLVMELIDAPSLSRLVRRNGPLSPSAAAAAGRSILSTLDAIHRAGVVHRDVKPSNILVDGDTPRLTDFGIALFGDGPMLTAAGSVLGTPAYMSPEQASGHRPGPEADLYGLGATLYFAVEGQAPFAESGSWETARAVRSRPHRPAERLGPLESIVDALLAKDPEQRPASDEINVALQAVAGPASQAHAGVGSPRSPRPPATAIAPGAGPPTPDPPPPADDERQARQLAVWVGLLLALLAFALLLLFFAVREQPAQAAALAAVAVGDLPWRRSRQRGVIGCNRSTRCGRSSSQARSSRPC